MTGAIGGVGPSGPAGGSRKPRPGHRGLLFPVPPAATGGLPDPRAPGLTARTVAGGLLVQTRDAAVVDDLELKVVTRRKPTPAELADLKFAFRVAKTGGNIAGILWVHHITLDSQNFDTPGLQKAGGFTGNAAITEKANSAAAQFKGRQPLPTVTRPFSAGLKGRHIGHLVPQGEQHEQDIFRYLGGGGTAHGGGNHIGVVQNGCVGGKINPGKKELNPTQVGGLFGRGPNPVSEEHFTTPPGGIVHIIHLQCGMVADAQAGR